MPQSHFVMPTLYFVIVYWLSRTQFKSTIFNRNLTSILLLYLYIISHVSSIIIVCGVYKLESTLLQVAVDVVMDFR